MVLGQVCWTLCGGAVRGGGGGGRGGGGGGGGGEAGGGGERGGREGVWGGVKVMWGWRCGGVKEWKGVCDVGGVLFFNFQP